MKLYTVGCKDLSRDDALELKYAKLIFRGENLSGFLFRPSSISRFFSSSSHRAEGRQTPKRSFRTIGRKSDRRRSGRGTKSGGEWRGEEKNEAEEDFIPSKSRTLIQQRQQQLERRTQGKINVTSNRVTIRR